MSDEAECVGDVPIAARAPRSRFATAESQAKRASLRDSGSVVRGMFTPIDLPAPERAQLGSLIYTTRAIKHGEALYRTSDDFQSIYAVRTGSFKTVVMHRDGYEQVTGFHLIGDTIGLDGVCQERHSCDAIALEDSSVYVIPFSLLEARCRENCTLQHYVLQMMSGEIVRESVIMMLLGTMNAEQRLAAFLLNLSQRMKTRGYSAFEFHVRMTREEIGSYLGLKLETVSRMFSRFQAEGILDTNGKRIRIVDFERLAKV